MLARFSVLGRSARAAAARLHTAAVHAKASQLTMPVLPSTMHATISLWGMREGESFSTGDLLVQIETEELQLDVEAENDGVLVKVLLPEGTVDVASHTPLAIIAEKGDDLSSIDIAGLSVAKNKEQA